MDGENWGWGLESFFGFWEWDEVGIFLNKEEVGGLLIVWVYIGKEDIDIGSVVFKL